MDRSLCLPPHRRLLAAAGLSLLACGSESGSASPGGAAGQLRRGEALYARHCASCHGATLQGQPNWRRRRPDGSRERFGH